MAMNHLKILSEDCITVVCLPTALHGHILSRQSIMHMTLSLCNVPGTD